MRKSWQREGKKAIWPAWPSLNLLPSWEIYFDSFYFNSYSENASIYSITNILFTWRKAVPIALKHLLLDPARNLLKKLN